MAGPVKKLRVVRTLRIRPPRWQTLCVTRARILLAAAALVLARLAAYALIARGNPAGPLCRWDCGWYISIARFGYLRVTHFEVDHLQHAWPFFPVLPILLAIVRRATGLDFPSAACLVASACTILLAGVGQRYRALTRDGARASTWVVLTAAMPFGVYFATGYTEAPYALLSLATLLGLARHNPLAASLPCAALVVTRPTGILLAPAIAIASLRLASRRSGLPARLAALLPCLIAISGLLAWMAYCAALTGDPLRFMHAQADWRRHLSDPVHVLTFALHRALHGEPKLGYDPLWALAGLGAALLLALRRLWAEAFFLAATIFLALSSGSPESMARFVSANPVFLLFVADLLDQLPGRLRYTCLAASAGLQLVLFDLWIRNWHFLV